MIQNPYKYKGPLDPFKDNLICVPRKNQINQVTKGIIWGKYWAILGPRQIGKSTFLRQLPFHFTDAHYIYFDCEVSPKTEKDFYQMISKTIVERIPAEEIEIMMRGKIKGAVEFIDFLMGLRLKNDKKKIVLLFDEIELIPSLNDFLHVWRKIFHERHHKKELEKFSVVIAGSVDLVQATEGKTSPFNIAATHYIEPFSDSESKKLIDGPMAKAGIKMDDKAVKRLIVETSGHPPLVQQSCHILLDNAREKGNHITEDDVVGALDTLLKQSDNLDTLRQDLKLYTILEELVRRILKDEKLPYQTFKEFSVAGAGPIIDDKNGFCAIRNKIYKRFLEETINPLGKDIPKVFICFSQKDEKWKKAFSGCLEDTCHEIPFIWEIQKSKFEQERPHQLEEYINAADISLFLVSEHSLTPEFLLDNEILALLRQKAKKGKNVFPVLLPTAVLNDIQKLSEIVKPCKE